VTCITGTPGTGKSTVGDLLRGYGHTVLEIQVFAETRGVYSYIENGEILVIPIDDLMCSIERAVGPPGGGFIVGHLSHHFKRPTSVVVLRTNPAILEDRLREKGWGERKISENVEAEAMDLILSEALELHGDRVSEIDTSEIGEAETARRILDVHLEGKRYPPQTRDWLLEHILKEI